MNSYHQHMCNYYNYSCNYYVSVLLNGQQLLEPIAQFSQGSEPLRAAAETKLSRKTVYRCYRWFRRVLATSPRGAGSGEPIGAPGPHLVVQVDESFLQVKRRMRGRGRPGRRNRTPCHCGWRRGAALGESRGAWGAKMGTAGNRTGVVSAGPRPIRSNVAAHP